MREAYRLSQANFSSDAPPFLLLGYVYVGLNNEGTYATIQEKILASLHYLYVTQFNKVSS